MQAESGFSGDENQLEPSVMKNGIFRDDEGYDILHNGVRHVP
jgi:hypothetical protein